MKRKTKKSNMKKLIIISAIFCLLSANVRLFSNSDNSSFVKIEVDEKGMYNITYLDLINAGLDLPSINPQNINISNRGEYIPIVIAGEEDGKFDEDDYIQFYGTYNKGKTTTKDRYSETNTYILTWNNQKPVRYSIKNFENYDFTKVNNSIEKINYFKKKIHFEEDEWSAWRFPHPGGEDTDFTFWKCLDSKANNHLRLEFDLPGIIEDKAVIFKIKFYGLTHLAIKPDHHVIVKINDELIDDLWWDDAKEFLYIREKFDEFIFKERNNVLEISVPGDIAPANMSASSFIIDQVLLDWFEFEYESNNWIDNTYMEFETDYQNSSSETNLVEFKKIPSNELSIFDLTDNLYIKPFFKEYMNEASQISYSAYYLDTNRQSKQLAVINGKGLIPKSISKIKEQKYSGKQFSAEYIIITHKDFSKAAEKLADWKNKKGIKTIVVDVEDLYDEYNYGIFHPDGIRNFLKYAYENWAEPKPKYVLLIGDTTWDVKNILKRTDHIRSFIPTYYFQPREFLEYAADNWFVNFKEDSRPYTPSLAIGRFPVETLDQAMIIVNKTIEYEKNNTGGEWRRNCLIMTSQEDNFIADGIAAKETTFPPYFTKTEVYKNKTKKSVDVITNSFNDGVLFTTFFGHGGADLWGGLGFFTTKEVDELKNKNKYPISLAATCYTSTFDNTTDIVGIGEKLLRKEDGGSIAVLGTTWRSYYTYDHKFVIKMLESFFNKNYKILGDAILDVKNEIKISEINQSFTLLGDPTLEVLLPKLNIDLKLENGIAINKTNKFHGTIDKSINGLMEISLMDDKYNVEYKEIIKVKKGKFDVDLDIPLTINEGKGYIYCYVWTGKRNFLDGVLLKEVNYIYK